MDVQVKKLMCEVVCVDQSYKGYNNHVIDLIVEVVFGLWELNEDKVKVWD